MSKYGAKKTQIDGYTFDSRAEAAYYSQLKLLKKAKQILDFELQPKFEIAESYIHPVTGKKIAAKHYKADFKVIHLNETVEIVDVKSKPTMTPVYRLKKHLFESRYNMELKEVGAIESTYRTIQPRKTIKGRGNQNNQH